jgi:hypothetical protein
VARWNLTALQSLASGKRTLRSPPGQYTATLVVDDQVVMATPFVVEGRQPNGTLFEDEETTLDTGDADERARIQIGGQENPK